MAKIEKNIVYLTAVECAELLGMTRRNFQRWGVPYEKEGRLHYYKLIDLFAVYREKQQTPEELCLEVERAKLAVEQTRRAKVEANKAEKDIELYDAKIRIEAEKGEIDKERATVALQMKQLECETQKGKYLLSADVERLYGELCAEVKIAFLSLPCAIAPELFAAETKAELSAILTAQIREILTRLADES